MIYDGAKVIQDSLERLFKEKPNLFKKLLRREETYSNRTKAFDCRKIPVDTWEIGEILTNYIKNVIKYLTFYIYFINFLMSLEPNQWLEWRDFI